MFGDQVDNLSFAFVAPLGADDDDRGHGVTFSVRGVYG
jgi:hypothetical protein